MREMIRRFPLVFVAVMISSCQTTRVGGCSFSDNKEIVYHATGTGVVNRFDMDHLWHSTEGLDFLECREKPTNHFGGNINLVSNEDFLGMSSPYTIVVPKDILGQKQWTINNISCLADEPVTKSQRVTVTCVRNGSSSTSFVYEPSVGVVEYVYSRNPDLKFHLVGEWGLFPQR